MEAEDYNAQPGGGSSDTTTSATTNTYQNDSTSQLPASSPSGSLAGRSATVASVRKGLAAFQSLVNTTSSCLAVVCGVCVLAGIVLGVGVHYALFILSALFGLVLAALSYLSGYTKKIVSYVGVAIEVLDYDPTSRDIPQQLIDRFGQAFGSYNEQKLRRFIRSDGSFDISGGIRQLIHDVVEQLLISKLHTFCYAPGVVCAVMAAVLLVLAFMNHSTFALYVTFLITGSVLLFVSAGIAVLGNIIYRGSSNQIRRLLSFAEPKNAKLTSANIAATYEEVHGISVMWCLPYCCR